jgi:DNA-binding beta-propeller fold protein YncE
MLAEQGGSMGRVPAGRSAVAIFVTALAALAAPTLTTPATAAAELVPALFDATLVRTTHTSRFSPPSPDPAGITYLANRDRLLISDSEVNEMPIYDGVNLFYTTRAGKKTSGATTLRFSAEPTGVDHNPVNDHLFVSDDDARRIYEVAPGPDGRHGTGDDVGTSFSTREAGNKDPEDVAFDADKGHLLVVDGSQARVYRYTPGKNGRFDGIPPHGDDEVSHFDVGHLGAKDPEGIAYDEVSKTVLVLDHKTQKIYVLGGDGLLLTTIDISAADPVVPSGLTVAPASNGSGKRNLYIVDRGLDNDPLPDENDGRLYEMSVSLSLLRAVPGR